MAVSKVCEVCGKGFEVINSRAEKAKTCSAKCKYASHVVSYAEGRTNCKCQVCSKEFQLSASRIDRGNGKFCSKNCMVIGRNGVERAKRVDDGDVAGMLGGYLLEHERGHPFAYRGRVFAHRLIVERWMREIEPDHEFMISHGGTRYLNPDICVHHKNEIKTDNSRSNLVACTKSAHAAFHSNKAVAQHEVWPQSEATLLPGQYVEKSEAAKGNVARVTCTCEKCGINFTRRKSSLAQGSGRFCSIQCRGGTTTATCETCGIPFVVGLSVAGRGHGKFCSRSCYHINQRQLNHTNKENHG